MKSIKSNFGLATALFLATLFTQLSFLPENVFGQAPFYQGKTITIIQGREAGGSGDMRVRAIIPYLQKYIPGNPTVVSEFMPAVAGERPPITSTDQPARMDSRWETLAGAWF
jgi:hypothetical protein